MAHTEWESTFQMPADEIQAAEEADSERAAEETATFGRFFKFDLGVELLLLR